MTEENISNTETKNPETITNEFSKEFAEALNKQHNPLTEPVYEEFKSEPFFKEEEKPEEEVVSETKVEETKEEEKVETKTEEVPEERKITEQDILGFLLENQVQVNSVDEIKSLLEENKKYKGIESELRELTQEERARLELGREHGDFGLYDHIKNH
jgi:hypothetical protein